MATVAGQDLHVEVHRFDDGRADVDKFQRLRLEFGWAWRTSLASLATVGVALDDDAGEAEGGLAGERTSRAIKMAPAQVPKCATSRGECFQRLGELLPRNLSMVVLSPPGRIMASA